MRTEDGEEQWILAEVVSYNSHNHRYIVDDIDEEGHNEKRWAISLLGAHVLIVRCVDFLCYCIVGSVPARGICKEWCFLTDQSIALVLIKFFRPHQKKILHLKRRGSTTLQLFS